MRLGNRVGVAASIAQLLEQQTRFDGQENLTVGATATDLTAGTLAGLGYRRDQYYCRGIYNPNGTPYTVVFRYIGDSTNYTAYINPGNYFMAYGDIGSIRSTGDGSTAGVIRLYYKERPLCDNTEITRS